MISIALTGLIEFLSLLTNNTMLIYYCQQVKCKGNFPNQDANKAKRCAFGPAGGTEVVFEHVIATPLPAR